VLGDHIGRLDARQQILFLGAERRLLALPLSEGARLQRQPISARGRRFFRSNPRHSRRLRACARNRRRPGEPAPRSVIVVHLSSSRADDPAWPYAGPDRTGTCPNLSYGAANRPLIEGCSGGVPGSRLPSEGQLHRRTIRFAVFLLIALSPYARAETRSVPREAIQLLGSDLVLAGRLFRVSPEGHPEDGSRVYLHVRGFKLLKGEYDLTGI
jgi:hypothetical protein